MLDAGCGKGQAHPRVSLNLDSDGNGAGIIVVGGSAAVDAAEVDPRVDKACWDKHSADAEQFGLAEAIADYNTRLKITIDKVWTAPAEG